MQDHLSRELFAMYRRLGAFERDVLCCGDVTVSQCFALQRLLDAPEDVSSLASAMGITPGGGTRLVDGMVKRGWVVRARDPEDRRRVLLQLSDTGEAQALDLRARTEALLADVLAQLDPEEGARVLDAIATLRAALDRAVDRCCAPGCCA